MTATTEGTTDALELERQLCFAVSLASRAVVAAYRPVLEPLGLTHSQYLVMLALWGESPLSLTRLGRMLQLEPATLSPLVRRLETLGLVVRKRSGDDARVLAIGLTAEGRMLRARAESIPETMMDRFGMTSDEAAALHGSMMKLIAAADR